MAFYKMRHEFEQKALSTDKLCAICDHELSSKIHQNYKEKGMKYIHWITTIALAVVLGHAEWSLYRIQKTNGATISGGIWFTTPDGKKYVPLLISVK